MAWLARDGVGPSREPASGRTPGGGVGKDEERLWRLTPQQEPFELDAGKEFQTV